MFNQNIETNNFAEAYTYVYEVFNVPIFPYVSQKRSSEPDQLHVS